MEENNDYDFQLSDDDMDSNDLGLLDSSSQNIVSKYITESEVNDFFNFNNHAGLNFVHVNCRSIKKNFGPLNNFLNLFSSKLTAIAVTETWLTDPLSDVYSILTVPTSRPSSKAIS